MLRSYFICKVMVYMEFGISVVSIKNRHSISKLNVITCVVLFLPVRKDKLETIQSVTTH